MSLNIEEVSEIYALQKEQIERLEKRIRKLENEKIQLGFPECGAVINTFQDNGQHVYSIPFKTLDDADAYLLKIKETHPNSINDYYKGYAIFRADRNNDIFTGNIRFRVSSTTVPYIEDILK